MSINSIVPEIATYEGCPVRTKEDVILGHQGVAAEVIWNFRDDEGNVLDISDFFPSDPVDQYVMQVLIQSCDEGDPLASLEATVLDPETGQISFDLPAAIYEMAGVFPVHVGLEEVATGDILVIGHFLLSIERSAFRSSTYRSIMPSVQEIRMRMMDSAIENHLLGQVEFSSSDIVDAIRTPVRMWNETPPQMRRFVYNCTTFPFYELWMGGVVGQLLGRAVMHYQRVKLKTSHGGISGDDQDRDKDYLNLSMIYKQEFKENLRELKYSLNRRQVGGIIPSTYMYTGGSSGWRGADQ